MAALGLKQLDKFPIAYLGTVRKDGAARVHPVSPIIAQGRLFVATAPDSPKRLDLRRDGRYAMHLLPGKNDEEFSITGRARLVTDDPARAAVVAAAGHTVREIDWIFEYDIERAMTAYWEKVGQPGTYAVRQFWPARQLVRLLYSVRGQHGTEAPYGYRRRSGAATRQAARRGAARAGLLPRLPLPRHRPA